MAVISRSASSVSTKSLVPFLAISFGLTWGIVAMVILFYEQMIALFGDMRMSNPLFILAVYSPGIAGLFLVWWHYGLKGLGSFLRRLTLWRAPIRWWLFLIFGIPAVVYTGAAIKGTLNDPFPFSPWYEVFPALMLALFLGPIEEFGWRGLALPLLQRRFSPAWAGLILGVIWATWHIPSFLMSGTPQSAWSFGPFFLGVVAISVLLTPFDHKVRNAVLLGTPELPSFPPDLAIHSGSSSPGATVSRYRLYCNPGGSPAGLICDG